MSKQPKCGPCMCFVCKAERAEVAKCPDANVEAIRQRLLDRAEQGLKTYGVTTERTDLSVDDWLTHAIDEALDLSVYLQKIRGVIRERTGLGH